MWVATILGALGLLASHEMPWEESRLRVQNQVSDFGGLRPPFSDGANYYYWLITFAQCTQQPPEGTSGLCMRKLAQIVGIWLTHKP